MDVKWRCATLSAAGGRRPCGYMRLVTLDTQFHSHPMGTAPLILGDEAWYLRGQATLGIR